MPAKHETFFKGLATFLSLVFAGLLLPTIIPIHGLVLSLVYTGLGVGFIWFAFYGIGQYVTWAVQQEINKKNKPQQRSINNNN